MENIAGLAEPASGEVNPRVGTRNNELHVYRKPRAHWDNTREGKNAWTEAREVACSTAAVVGMTDDLDRSDEPGGVLTPGRLRQR